jgi:DNA-binding response OmpR family regulator
MPNVLIVDDDPDVVGLVRTTLGLAGHQVLATTELAKVVPLAVAARVEAVILDVLLPGFTGYDAYRALRGNPRTAGIPVLLLSSLASGADRVRGLTAGADDYLAKPFAPVELVLRIGRLMQPRGPAAEDGPATLAGQLAAVEERLTWGETLGGATVGRYELIDVLGRGGMGVVARAWDPRLQRQVAVKLLHAGPGSSAGEESDRVHRLLLEAIMVAQVSHPNVVAVHDVAEASRGGFVAMELVEGCTLEAHLRSVGVLPAAQAVPLAAALFRGLEAAHRRQLVHHDVKPGNLLLGHDGSIKLTDFGVAELTSATRTGGDLVAGTPGYLPPEVIQGAPFETAGDLFAAGVVLYQCLSGELPFSGATLEDTLVRTVYGDPAPLAPNADVMPELEGLVRSLVAKDPSNRPGSAGEVADQLERMCIRHGWRWTAPAAIAA